MISFGPKCSCTPGGMLWYVLICQEMYMSMRGIDDICCLARLFDPPFLFIRRAQCSRLEPYNYQLKISFT
jgi:hypothetical protein